MVILNNLFLYTKRTNLASFFFLNDTAPPEIYPFPLHAPLPIYDRNARGGRQSEIRRSLKWSASPAEPLAVDPLQVDGTTTRPLAVSPWKITNCQLLAARSEEHTSELQSPCNLVCRLLLEKKTKR